MKYRIENSFFLVFMGFEKANDNWFHSFGTSVIWLCKSLEKVFEIVFEGVCENPGK